MMLQVFEFTSYIKEHFGFYLMIKLCPLLVWLKAKNWKLSDLEKTLFIHFLKS